MIYYIPIETEAIGLVNMDESIMPGLLEELLEGFGVRIRCEAIKQDQNMVYVAGG